jgi:hypothetical protein
MRQPLEGAHHAPCVVELRATTRALFDVRHERREAESGLAVEKLIDFVW